MLDLRGGVLTWIWWATLLLGRSSVEAGWVSLSLRVSYHGWGGEVRRRECHRTSSSGFSSHFLL